MAALIILDQPQSLSELSKLFGVNMPVELGVFEVEVVPSFSNSIKSFLAYELAAIRLKFVSV